MERLINVGWFWGVMYDFNPSLSKIRLKRHRFSTFLVIFQDSKSTFSKKKWTIHFLLKILLYLCMETRRVEWINLKYCF